MTEEIRYIANLQRQEEFDNEVTELKDELKRLEQENKELKEDLKSQQMINLKQQEIALDYWNALEEIKVISDNYNLTVNERRKQIADKINEVLQ